MSSRDNSRERARANPAVTEFEYVTVMGRISKGDDWLRMLGPNLIKAFHEVTPGMIASLSAWIGALIDAGCTNGVIWPARFESALRRRTHAIVAVDKERFISQATTHMQKCLQLVREYAHEEVTPSLKRLKTGSFRKKYNSSDIIVVGALARQIKVTSMPKPLVPYVPKLELPELGELMRGRPLIFKQNYFCAIDTDRSPVFSFPLLLLLSHLL